MTTVALVAGGYGTRMIGTLGARIPKALAPVGDGTFIDHVLARLCVYGVDRVHLCLGDRAQSILDHIAKSPQPLPVTHSTEAAPLGVIGALKNAARHLPDVFTMLYGDVYPTTDPSVLEGLLDESTLAAMLIYRADLGHEPGNVQLGGRSIIGYQDGDPLPYVDAGMCALRKVAIAGLELGRRTDEKEFFPALINRLQITSYESRTPSLHVGDPDAYRIFLEAVL